MMFFILNYCRNSTIKISKYSLNKRYRGSITLLRYCSDKPHTNPSEYGGKHFVGPHLHIYKEGYDDKIAVDPSEIGIPVGSSIETVLKKILEFFNVSNIPNIQNDLFVS